MRAVVGDDDSSWKPMPGYFPPVNAANEIDRCSDKPINEFNVIRRESVARFHVP
jgi:hypothetical protein